MERLSEIAIVVPCFNEAARLDTGQLRSLAQLAVCDVIVVDDGSTDGTADLVARATAGDSRIRVVRLPSNGGKAAAVRHGLHLAAAAGYTVVGFCDADFATPVGDVSRLVQACTNDAPVVIGSRVGLLGHRIERSPIRHYTGRIFATASSLALGFQVYDTQCGAKVFLVGQPLSDALDEPFMSRWAFDVELLGRLAVAHGSVVGFLEVPLQSWRDADGSKLTTRASLRAVVDLWFIRRALRRRALNSPRPDQPRR